MTTSKKQPSPKTELIKFNKTIVPFHIFDHENGLYSLCLHEGNKYEKTFRECRKTPNDPEGNGYNFEALIKKFISEKMPDDPFNQIIGSTPLKISFFNGTTSENDSKLVYDSECGMFCVYAKDKEKLMNLAAGLKSICDDASLLKDLISRTNFFDKD